MLGTVSSWASLRVEHRSLRNRLPTRVLPSMSTKIFSKRLCDLVAQIVAGLEYPSEQHGHATEDDDGEDGQGRCEHERNTEIQQREKPLSKKFTTC